MYEDDRDALAAEYVLGTLSTDERDQAEALIVIDQGFAEIVRQWERRLGELNVMVEAVEPPPAVWEKLQNEIKRIAAAGAAQVAAAEGSEEPVGYAASSPSLDAVPELVLNFPPESTLDFSFESQPIVPEQAVDQPPPEQSLPAQPADGPPPPPEPQEPPVLAPEPSLLEPIAPAEQATAPEDAVQDRVADLLNIPSASQEEPSSPVAALASSLVLPAGELETEQAPQTDFLPPPPLDTDRSADVVRLMRKLRRWRRTTFVMGALAAALVGYIAVVQFVPDLIPQLRRLAPVKMQAPAPADRLVAALNQEPTAPAFLLTVDPSDQTLTVRAVSAKPEAGRSYELWLIPPQSKPRSLGVIGVQQFTRRPIPAGLDIDALRGANYAVSLEPEGGSPSGAPTGPILFTGKLVDSLPGTLPPS